MLTSIGADALSEQTMNQADASVAASTWTPARVEHLKARWSAEDVSCADIAAELNQIDKASGPLSRNSVIGKARRLKLPAKKPPADMARRAKRSAEGKGRTIRIRRVAAWRPRPATIVCDAEPALSDQDIPIGQRRTIATVRSGECRYPFGDPKRPDFFLCGGKALTGLPYCGYHTRVAYRPSEGRQR
jgi:GcrA cell cycle regulator